MKINTKDFGIVEVEENAVYEFDSGLYGFEEVKRYAIFHQSFDGVSLLNLQAVDNISPSFLVLEPWDLYPDYCPTLTEEDLKLCDVSDINELIFLVITNVSTSIGELSVNIKSPVVLNPKSKKGRQVILQNPDYKVRYHPFLQEEKDGD